MANKATEIVPGEWYAEGAYSAHAWQEAIARAVEEHGADVRVWEVCDPETDTYTLAVETDLCDFFPDAFDSAGNYDPASDPGGCGEAILTLAEGETCSIGGGAAPVFTWTRVQ